LDLPETPTTTNWWAQAPSWPTLIVAIALFLSTCWYARLPAQPLRWVLSALTLWPLFFLTWTLRLAVSTASQPARLGQILRMHPMRWALAPSLCAAALIVFFSGVCCRIGFELSRTQMDRVMQQALASPDHPPTPQGWVGLYRIERVTCYRSGLHGESDPQGEWGCTFTVAGADEGHGGFNYASAHREPSIGERDFGGGWFSWYHYPT
jgi:hypothetical protein